MRFIKRAIFSGCLLCAASLQAQSFTDLVHETGTMVEESQVSPGGTMQLSSNLAPESLRTAWNSLLAQSLEEQEQGVPAEQTLLRLREAYDLLREQHRATMTAVEAARLEAAMACQSVALGAKPAEAREAIAEALASLAASTQIEAARMAFLDVVEVSHARGQLSGQKLLPDDLWNDVLRLDPPPSLEAIAYLELANAIDTSGGAPEPILRQGELLERAMALGPDTGVYDAALYRLGSWREKYGTTSYSESGNLVLSPENAAAVELYARVLRLFDREGSAVRRSAEEAAERILRQEIAIHVEHSFRPETELQFGISWRNLGDIVIELFPVDPIEELVPSGPAGSLTGIQTEGRKSVLEQVITANPQRRHAPRRETIRSDKEIAPGAYLVVARSGSMEARELIVVTDYTAVTRHTPNQVLTYLAQADTGEPAFNAHVVVWHRERADADAPWIKLAGQTELSGVCLFESDQLPANRDTILVAELDGNAVLLRESHGNIAEVKDTYRAFAYASSSAYYPGDEVQWKIFLRRITSAGTQPAQDDLVYFEILDPGGQALSEGELRGNRFGSASHGFSLPADTPLGAYQLRYGFLHGRWAGQTTLFEVIPPSPDDFQVGVDIDESTGIRQLGTDVVGEISANYSWGGPVAGAEGELVVFYRRVQFSSQDAANIRTPPFHWRVLDRQSFVLDARGQARFAVDTGGIRAESIEVRVEARITTNERGEVVGHDVCRLGTQPYTVFLENKKRLYSPGDDIEFWIRAVDIDGQPVSDLGQLRLFRERWVEVYVHRRRGDEISGEHYRALPRRSLLGDTRSDYVLKQSGFVTEELESLDLQTDANGIARYLIDNAREGYYRVSWLSKGWRGQPILAEKEFWVVSRADESIGYRAEGVQLVLEKDLFAPGETAYVLVNTVVPNCSVLLLKGHETISSWQIVKLKGSSRMVRIAFDPEDSPNTFLEAILVTDETVQRDLKEAQVPQPEERLQVGISSESLGFEPGDQAFLEVNVRDEDGEPVVAEYSFSVSDLANDTATTGRLGSEFSSFVRPRRERLIVGTETVNSRPFFRPTVDAPTARPDRHANVGTANIDHPGPISPAAEPDHRTSARTQIGRFNHWLPQETSGEGSNPHTVGFPDLLGQWQVRVFAVTPDGHFGEAALDLFTRLPLLVEIDMADSAHVGDTIVIDGKIANNTRTALEIRTKAELSGGIRLEGPAEAIDSLAARREKTLSWQAQVLPDSSGAVKLRSSSAAYSDQASAQLRIRTPSQEGRRIVGNLTDSDEIALSFELPNSQLARAESKLYLGVHPLAAVVNSLDTLSTEPGLPLDHWMNQVLAIAALRAQFIGDGLPAEDFDALMRRFGKFPPAADGDDLSRSDWATLSTLCLADLLRRQHDNGSWGWLDEGQGDLWHTAYATWALQLANTYGLRSNPDSTTRAQGFLEPILVEAQSEPLLQSWILHALASRYRGSFEGGRPSRLEARTLLELIKQRERLSPASLAMVALAARDFGLREDAELILENLARRLVWEAGSQSGWTPATLEPGTNFGLYAPEQETNPWSLGTFEATALALQAFSWIEPSSSQIAGIQRWLFRHQPATGRARTLHAIAQCDAYLAQSGRFGPVELSWSLNGTTQNTTRFAPALNELTLDPFVINPADLRAGKNEIRVRRTVGFDPFFAQFVPGLDPVSDSRPPAEEADRSTWSVHRHFEYRRQQPTLLRGMTEVRKDLEAGESINRGGQVTVVTRLEIQQSSRYLHLDIPNPSGFAYLPHLGRPGLSIERVPDLPGQSREELRSMEAAEYRFFLRNDSAEVFFERLPAGIWEIRYTLLAEAAGRFLAPPATLSASFEPARRVRTGQQFLQCNLEAKR